MTIQFDAIPVDIRTNAVLIEFSNRRATRGVVGIPSRMLLIAQRLSTGSATPLSLYQVVETEEAEGLGGRGSQLHRMVRALRGGNSTSRRIAAANAWTELWVIALDDLVAGAKAAGNILFGGDPTAAGTLNLYIGGERVRVAVTAENTPAQVATAVAAAINAVTDLPVTAAVNGSVAAQVDITARHKGECGNDIDLRLDYYAGEYTPLGLTATITALSGGTGNPDIAPALALMADVWYTDLITPWTDAANLTALRTEMESRWGPLQQVGCYAYTAAKGTFSALSTLGNAKNDKLLTIIGAGKSPTPPDEWAAQVGGVCAYERKRDPARPMQTVPLPGVLPPAPADRFDQTKRNLLLFDGISTYKVDADGAVAIDRIVTTYQKNSLNIDDPSYLDATTLWCLETSRYHFRAKIAQRYPRHKLAPDGNRFGVGTDIATPSGIFGTLVAAYGDLIEAGICHDMPTFKADSLVEIDPADRNRANAKLAVTFVGGLIVFAAQIEFRL